MPNLQIIQPTEQEKALLINRENYDHYNEERLTYKAEPGINEELVRKISTDKNEPEWMLQKRLNGLKIFKEKSLPEWGPDLSELDLDKIVYYMRPDAKKNAKSWDDVPEDIKRTYERLGIPQAEQRSLGGAGVQYESEVVYHNLKKELEDKGVIFLDMDEAVKEYPEMVRRYFMTTCVPIHLHKFSALHAAVWSGGTFIYVPKGIKVDVPLQAYFRMNAKKGGQFEHTLIIVDEEAEIHYIEGCFTKGNKITTNPDYKNIEDIKEGDKILTHNGNYKRVKEKYITPYSGTLAKIKLWGDAINEIEVTNDHPFLYVDRENKNERNKNWNPRWNVPRYFEKGSYLALPINKTITSKDFYEIDIDVYKGRKKGFKKTKKKVPSTKEFFKLAGYYLAEGSISSGHYLNFSFNINEREYIEEVKSLLKKVFNIDKTLEMHHKVNNGTSIVVCSTELCRIFEQFGKKANLKIIPQWMMIEDKEKQKELIKSYFFGDGNYYKKKTNSGFKEVFRINSVSEKLIIQCRDILLRSGIVSFINKRDRSKEDRQTMYTLGITGEWMKKFGDLVDIKIKTKINNKKRATMFYVDEDFAFFPIRELEFKTVENIPTYNFSVEDNETYCVSGAAVHNCSSPVYLENSLHAGCVEIHVMKNARARYSSIENWSKNTYNLNTKRAIVYEDAIMEWVNGNMGSKVTMLYPCSVLIGKNAKTDYIGIAYAGENQYQDTGCKVYHLAENTSSSILSKGISMYGGTSSYRGLIEIKNGAINSKSNVRCDGLMLDNKSKAMTFPSMNVHENNVKVAHEAAVGKVEEEQLFYLMSRGLSEDDAIKLIVSGFIEPLIKALPMEYAVELNRLIELEIENSVC
ncbi:MAG: SufD family Fe-S cluster assembly protein [Nanoarchaeota archaeon]